MKKVTCSLFDSPVEITYALVSIAARGDNLRPEHDVLIEAANYICDLEHRIKSLNKVFKEKQAINLHNFEVIIEEIAHGYPENAMATLDNVLERARYAIGAK